MLQTVPGRTEGMPARNRRNGELTVDWSTRPQGKQSEAKKCCHGVDRLQNDLWYGPTILESKSSKNVQNIQQNRKIHFGSHEKLESWMKSRRKNYSRGENLERHPSNRYAFTITTCYSNDVPQSHIEEVYWGLQIY